MCSRGDSARAVEVVKSATNALESSPLWQVHPTVLWACGASLLNRTLKSIATHTPTHRRTIVFVVDDYEFALVRSPRLFVVRTSLRRSLRTPDETVMPYLFDGLPNVLPPLRKSATARPVVGFHGRNNSYRAPLLRDLSLCPHITTCFVVQNVKVWKKNMSPSTRMTAINDFQRNVMYSHFTITTRGAGNFAMRFWQVLSAGRIPAMVDTDLSLPLARFINWRSCIVLESTPALVVARIIAIWADGDAVERRQERCGAIHERYFATCKHYVKWLSLDLMTKPGLT